MSDSNLAPQILPVTVDGALSEWNQQDLLVPTSLSNADFSLYGGCCSMDLRNVLASQ